LPEVFTGVILRYCFAYSLVGARLILANCSNINSRLLTGARVP
jgi:hypothetical protein